MGREPLDAERDVPVGDRAQEDAPPAVVMAEHWWDRPFVVLDTETTAADPLAARIVQISCLAVYPDGNVSPQSYTAIVNPGIPIAPELTAIHGIDDAKVKAEGVPLVDALYAVLRRLHRWTKYAPVVIYNAVYDWPLLWEEMGRTDLCWTEPLARAQLVDPLLLERTFNGVAQGNFTHKLAVVAGRYDVQLPAEGAAAYHSARFDAWATAAILRAQVAKFAAVRAFSLEALQAQQRTWFAQWRDQLNAYWERKGKPQRVTGEWPFGDRRRLADLTTSAGKITRRDP